MSLPVLVAVSDVWEAPLVTRLEVTGSGVRVVRRCADLTELLSAAEAGLAQAAIVSADLPRLDGEAFARLAAVGVAVVGLADPADPSDGARLVALGAPHVVDADTPAAEVAELVVAAVAQLASAPPAQIVADSPGLPVLPVLPVLPGQAGDRASTPTNGRVIAVWGPVGAPGRTTVAVTLAAEIAALGRAALLVDADTYGPSVAQVLGLLDESAGLTAAVRAGLQGGLDAVRLARLAPLVSPHLRVLTGLPRPGRWPELRLAGLDLVWQHVREVAEWTVVDCGFGLEVDEEITFDSPAPRRNGATLSALAAADVVIAVGAADPVGLQRLVRGLEELDGVLAPGRVPRVVVTRVRAAAVGSSPGRRVSDALSRYAGVREVALVPDDRPACDAALLAGRTLTEVAPTSPARRAVAALAAELTSPPQRAPRASRRRRS